MVEAFQTGFGSDIYKWFLRVPSLGIFLQFFTVKSVKTTSQSEGNVDTPHPQPMVSGALVPQTIVFNSQPSKGLPPHPTTPAGPAPQPSGCQHASPRGTSSGTTIMHQDRGMIFLSHALSSRLIYNHRALRCRPTPPRYSVLQHQAGDPSTAHVFQPHVNLSCVNLCYVRTTYYPWPPSYQPMVSPVGTPLGLFVPQSSNFGYHVPQPYYLSKDWGG